MKEKTNCTVHIHIHVNERGIKLYWLFKCGLEKMCVKWKRNLLLLYLRAVEMYNPYNVPERYGRISSVKRSLNHQEIQNIQSLYSRGRCSSLYNYTVVRKKRKRTSRCNHLFFYMGIFANVVSR